ncbi:hypothetical protein [Mangrovimonas aestuarii]|uniref:hypothetical protein n=1 Tax=Mangrovimonas aestuarii TaxID=3018443 RepID=UPI0023793E2E|nr:hypothetical protein [Mangrovimonas aestuarii]
MLILKLLESQTNSWIRVKATDKNTKNAIRIKRCPRIAPLPIKAQIAIEAITKEANET